jgi:uncharacterized protein YbaA (DUF1428 family)
MKGYIDLYLLPIPRKNLAAYRRLANRFGKVVQDHGALEYREFLGVDLTPKWAAHFPKLMKLKPGEVLISSAVEFRSRAHRDLVNKRAMEDPRMKKMMKMKPLFEMKRMYYGGFETIVKM